MKLTNNLAEMLIDNAEVALDHVMQDGLLKDIPIISNLVGLYKVKTTISDKIFYNKVVSFYESFFDVNPDSFQQWNKWANENIEEAEKIASSIVLHIDSQNELIKCKLIGHLFKKLIEEDLLITEFEEYIYAISMCSVRDLRKHCVDGGDSSPSHEASLCQRLQFVGFYSFTSESLSSKGLLEFEITECGCCFIELLKEFDWN